MRQFFRAFGLLTALAAAWTPQAVAQSAKDFYKGKTVTIVVGFSAGGGYDTYARTLARHIGEHIPGSPNVIVQNMPGAGSLTAVRYLTSGAPEDGTVMTAFNPGVITESLTQPDKIKMKFTDVAWIGSITRDFRVCYAWHATGIKSWDDMVKRKEFILGSTAKGTGSYVNGAILRNVFDVNVRQILGFPGSAEQRLAIERGELEGDCGSWSSIPDDWIRDKKINPIVRFSPARTPDIPDDVPFIGEFAKTQEQKDILNVLIAAGELGRPYIMSRNVPDERVQTMRQAFAATMRDPDFLADAKKQGLPVNPATGEEAEGIIKKIYQVRPELIAKARAAIE